MSNNVLPRLDELDNSLIIKCRSTYLARTSAVVPLSAILILILFILLMISLIFVPWVQTVEGHGRVIAYSPSERQQELDAPVDGRIDKWFVSEGEKVFIGDPIVDIKDIDPDIMERLHTEREAVENRLKASEQSLETSKINLDRQRLLWNKGISSRRSFELAELEYAKFLGELSSVSAELARIETRIARQASQSIVATRNGIVQKIFAPQGGVLVKQGDKLAIIVPESTDRAVELFVSGNDIPLLSVGREVRLQFEGWPAVQFSGWPSIAVGTFAGKINVIDPSDDGMGRFRIIVFPKENEIWPDPNYLRQGVRVVGWILLDSVRLGWELWRKFNAFPLSLPQKVSMKDSSSTNIEQSKQSMNK